MDKAEKKAIIFLFPLILFWFAIILIPLASSVIYAFQDVTIFELGEANMKFVGLRNFRQLFSNPQFMYNLYITGVMVLFIVSLTLAGALGFSVLFTSRLNKLKILQWIVISVWPISYIAWAIIMRMLFLPYYGPLTQLIKTITGSSPAIFTSSFNSILFAVLGISLKQIPYAMVLLMIGIWGIPREVIEAARIDGSSGWKLFQYIILPLIKPQIGIALVLTTGLAFGAAEGILGLTGGGPGYATETLAVRVAREATQWYNFSLANAIGLIILCISSILILFYHRLTQTR